jgi:hypothetical protein
MTKQTLNTVYADTALIDAKATTTWTDAARSAIDAGILDITRDARKLNDAGELIGLDSKKLKAESDKYLDAALPVWLSYAVTQLTTALAEAKKINKKSNEAAVYKAKAALSTAQDMLSVNVDGVRIFVSSADYAFLTMTSADYKACQHKDKALLSKFRDDKRNIMRVQFTRLVSKAWAIAGAKKASEPETYAALLVRFHKALTATTPDGSLKYAEELANRKVSPEIIEFTFRLLQDGTLMPQSVKNAAKQSKAISKQAAKQAA